MKTIAILFMFATTTHAASFTATVKSVDGKCGNATEIFVSTKTGETPLYQLHVPMDGQFKLELKDGEYRILAGTKKGCISDVQVLVKGANQTSELNLKLEKRKPSNSGMCIPCIMAGGGGPTGMIDPGGFTGNGYPYAVNYPWWGNWGNMTYPGYQNPCMWSGWGCNGGVVPGGGMHMNGGMGKPNIYAEGSSANPLQITIPEAKDYLLLATVPTHSEKGWTVSVAKNSFKNADVTYPYLFYDSRTKLKDVQSAEGFCGSKTDILDEMKNALKVWKYPNAAQKDFREYWTVRLSDKYRYCVYPQETLRLNANYPILVSGAEVTWRRVLFFVVPMFGEIEKAPDFLKPYVKIPDGWVPTAGREPAETKKALRFYEWGVLLPMID